jgi:hypothetical protein
MAKELWHGQEQVYPGVVEHWGKRYIWFKDHDGTHYMVRLDDDGIPVLV